MEALPLPKLLLLDAPVPTCPLTGEPVRASEAVLTLLGPEAVEFKAVLGRSAESGRWYVLLPDLAAMAKDEGWPLDAVEGFEVDGEPVTAGLLDAQGAVPWAAFRGLAEQARRRAAEPPPAPEAVRRLPVLPEAWEVAARGASWIHDQEPPRPAYLAVVVDPDGRIRHHALRPDTPHDAASLAATVRAATRENALAGFGEGRPRTLRVAEADLADALAEALDPDGISVETAPTALADEALADAVAEIGSPLGLPLFLPHADAEVRAYFEAARRFYRARPWRRLRGDRYVGVRLGTGPWFYVNVMGQMEEDPGLSLFDSWLRLCRFIHNEPSPFDLMEGASETAQLEAAGALEGVTLFPLSTLLPEDGMHLRALGIEPILAALVPTPPLDPASLLSALLSEGISLPEGRSLEALFGAAAEAAGAEPEDQYPLPVRYTPEGITRSSYPLSVFTALLETIVTAVKARRAAQITSIKQTFEATGLTLRYPACGDEHLGEEAGAYRLVIEGRDTSYANPLPAGSRLEIDAPGLASLEELHRALRDEVGGTVWFSGFGSGDYYLWQARSERGTPSPRVADLDGLPALWLSQIEVQYPLTLTPLPDSDLDTIRVRRRS